MEDSAYVLVFIVDCARVLGRIVHMVGGTVVSVGARPLFVYSALWKIT